MMDYDSTAISIFWFRRDLRLRDNHGLYQALKSGLPVLPVFIFDREILNRLPKADRRVQFIHAQLEEINREVIGLGSSLRVEYGRPEDVYKKLFKEHKVARLYFNEDYEPYALARDQKITQIAQASGVEVLSFKDQVIFAKKECVKDNGEPYLVYTPYSRRWLGQVTPQHLKPFPSEKGLQHLMKCKAQPIPTLKEMGFEAQTFAYPDTKVEASLLKSYANTRDLLAESGTSRLGVHLRFGTVSVRELAAKAQKTSLIYLKELIWREFFMQMLYSFPKTVDQPFDSRYEGMPWRNDEADFAAWCEGRTGYPVVDAGMRELNATGHMHNRARMIVASFLTKHLLIDWRWGERYFAERLLDFELASNVGNWQWAAGCGCDAAPYFRVFNPELQAKKFDAEGKYVRRWVPEWDRLDYSQPIVEHDMARKRAIATYDRHLKKGKNENSADRGNRAHR